MTRSVRSLRAALLVTTILSFPAVAKASQISDWASTTTFSGHVEAGIAFNPAAPRNDENVGSLMTDRANQVEMNQLFLTVERPIDTTSSKFDIGFKVQGNFGTDARYTHSLAETDHLFHSRYQFDFNEATVNMHIPTSWTFLQGGVDVKAGQFPSPFSAEVIDATQNQLYSHSYIFNFGVPAKSTGILTTSHINPMLDIYAGFDTGVNGGVTADGDNNHNIKPQFGFGLNNLMGGKLSLVALTHMGTENPTPSHLSSMRYLNDAVATYKANDKWTFVTDVNYAEEDSTNSTAYGVAQYATYVLNDNVSLTGRGEVWRDNGGWVTVNPGYFDSANAQRGLPVSAGQYSPPHTTYGELTLGLSWKPAGLPKAITGTVVRPELRVDQSLNGTKPFGGGDDNTQFTPAVDVIVPF